MYLSVKSYNCKLERIVQYLFPDASLDMLRNNIDMFEKKMCIDKLLVPQRTRLEGKPADGETINNFRRLFVMTTDRSFLDFIENNDHVVKNEAARGQSLRPYVANPRTISMLSSAIKEALAILPSDEKITMFVQIFLNICETNYFYAIHLEVYGKLVDLYEARRVGDLEYFYREWPFLVIVLSMLSVSAGFDYIGSKLPIPQEEYSVNPGYNYYFASMPFVGFLLDSKAIEGAQALLMLGVFLTTNKNEQFGLADGGYSFMALALEIAISNKLYTKDTFSRLPDYEAEAMKRLWWSCYTLERRHGFNLGKPELFRIEDITVGLPEYSFELRNNSGSSNHLNQRVVIQLTMVFIKLTKLEYTKTTSANRVEIDTKMIRALADDVEECRASFPEYALIENLDPSADLYRGNVHLHLNYYLAKIYIGKPFLLYKVENQLKIQENSYETAIVDHLSSICIDAAFCSIELLSVLEKNSKLGQFSFTDLNFCNISLFVILVYLNIDKSDNTLLFLLKGLGILRTLSRGSATAKLSLNKLQKFIDLVSVVDTKTTDSSQAPYALVDLEAGGMGFPELPSDIDGFLQLENFGFMDFNLFDSGLVLQDISDHIV